MLHLPGHGPHVFRGYVRVYQQHVGGGHIELVPQLAFGNDVLHIPRQALAHVVVHLAVGLVIAVKSGRKDEDKDCNKHREYFYDTGRQLSHIGDQGTVAGLLQRLVEYQDQRRQHSDAAQHAQQHALCHNDAQIPAHGKGHEAQCDEPGHGSDGTAHHRGQGGLDSGGHGLLVIRAQPTLLVVAVPQENGVVHSDGQLEYCRQRLSDVGDLAQEVVGAHIHQNHHADAGQEHEGHQKAVQQNQHGRAGQSHGDAHVNGFLHLAQILQVGNQGGHTGYKAPLPGNGADFPDGIHGQIGGGRGVKEHGHHGGVFGVKRIVDAVRQQFHGDGHVHQGIIPQHSFHMIHLLYARL